ncbi:MAG: amidohydrolase [Chloroflexi bacterium]|nr:amidohydrolase [Chloroflexota bacterium]
MKIDAHTKIFPPSFARRRTALAKADATFGDLYGSSKAKLAKAEELVQALDGSGFDAAWVLNIGWQTYAACRESNDYILASAKRYPKRLVPFCSVNPMWGALAVKEIERCAALGARGLGELHPDTQGYDIANARVMAPVMEAARRRRLIVAAHASEPVGHRYPGKGRVTPERLLAFVETFPNQPIVLAHWGGGLPFYALMPEVRKALKNTYFDTAASPFLYEPKVFEAAATLIGHEKILFATDWPLIAQPRLGEQVAKAKLPTGAKRAIMSENARRLVG